MVLGVAAGMAVGVLNVVAIGNQWKLADYFDILDIPLLWLMPRRTLLLHGNYYPISDPQAYGLGLLCWIICYWTFIGWFTGALFCLVRDGMINEMVRDKGCRYTLFIGACGGMLIGSLNFLAASNGWQDLERVFDGPDQPINWLMQVLQDQFHVLDFLPADPSARFVCLHAVAVVYWAVIGFFAATLFCIVYIISKGKHARVTG